jgi:hypothetical protein
MLQQLQVVKKKREGRLVMWIDVASGSKLEKL